MDEAWNKGNLEIVDELLTHDHVTHDPRSPTKGLEAFKESIRQYRPAFPDCRCEIDDLLSIGDKIVVRRRFSGTRKNQLERIPAAGRRVNGTGITIQRFSGDRRSGDP